jgi:single-strand DNA-binding protein
VEIQYTAKGIPIYCFSIANNRKKMVNNKWVRVPSYFNFRLLGKRWERISSRFIKGQPVSIQGRLEQDSWEQDGKQRSRIKVTVTEIQSLWPCPTQHNAQSPEGEEYIPGDERAYDSEAESIPEVPLEEEK